MIVVVMGVAGAGKTTIGQLLAGALGCAFLDADTLHTPGNVEKMTRGTGLSDADRASWLTAIHARIRDAHQNGEDLVVACSALKQHYRSEIAGGIPVRWVYLKGPPDLIRDRLVRRTGHFAGVTLLDSQLSVLEEPRDAIVLDISRPPAAIAEEILARVR